MALVWVALGAGVMASVLIGLWRVSWDGCDPFDPQC